MLVRLTPFLALSHTFSVSLHPSLCLLLYRLLACNPLRGSAQHVYLMSVQWKPLNTAASCSIQMLIDRVNGLLLQDPWAQLGTEHH